MMALVLGNTLNRSLQARTRYQAAADLCSGQREGRRPTVPALARNRLPPYFAHGLNGVGAALNRLGLWSRAPLDAPAAHKHGWSRTRSRKCCQARAVLKRAALIAVAAACFSCQREQGATLNVVGSTSIQPFAELLNEEYARQYPGRRVDVQGGGSTAGLQAVANGLAQIGMCSRALKPDEAQQFTPVTIARDGLAIVVHPTNPVAGLSLEQLRGLFTGRIANWKDVGGRDGPVRLITREEGSGTRESFVNLVMGKERISRRALAQESNGAVKELVRGDPAAIGYMSLGLVGTDLRAVPIDGAAPTAENVLAGRYKLARPFLFLTRGTPTADAQNFIAFVLSPAGQRILESEGLVRAQ